MICMVLILIQYIYETCSESGNKGHPHVPFIIIDQSYSLNNGGNFFSR